MTQIVVGETSASIEDIISLSKGQAEIAISEQVSFRSLINAGSEFLEQEWRSGRPIYGVTTGYGDSCNISVEPELVEKLPAQLVKFHGCGLGKALDQESSRAVMAVRLFSLARGFSGVRVALLEQIASLFNHGVIPVIPEEGSVGASGDLTPLSYLAAVLSGERQVYFRDQVRPTAAVMKELNIKPITLQPKEALALMNGTSVMTALACQAFDRAVYLAKLSSRITALLVEALGGNKSHFSEKLFSAKPHPGQTLSASWIRADIGSTDHKGRSFNERFQERYSVRCAPHVIGVLLDSLEWARKIIEIEINSANDNPLIDAESKTVMHGGHFYGGHIALVMDTIKTAVANVADLLDRQLSLLIDARTNNGLPANLSGIQGPERAINHGLKAVQIAASAWAAEALKLTMPASVFSRSTECHNQDKVSMGTISARDALRILELTEQIAAGSLLAVAQGLELRLKMGQLARDEISGNLNSTFDQVREQVSFLQEDRELEQDLRKLTACIRNQKWQLYC